jgi:hypothetical protein
MAWRLRRKMFRMRYLSWLLIVVAIAAPAGAQSESKLALGGSIGSGFAPSSTVSGDKFGVGLLWRIGPSEEGFGWEGGLNWFAANVDHSVSGSPAFALGELHVRPIMVGYGYTHLVGPNAIKGSVQGGYAFSSFSTAPSAMDVYRDRLGALSLSTDAANTFVVKPQVSVWRDVSPRFGVRVTAGYLIARPNLTVRSTLGEERQRIRADRFMVDIGVVYSIF